MPTPAYLSIIGTTLGEITKGASTAASVGNIYQEGHEDHILVQAFTHRITMPFAPQSGQPTGQRVHAPLMITKIMDRSSPLLFSALTRGEVLTTCLLKFYRITTGGNEDHYFTIELEDAVIVDIQSRMANCQDPAQAHFSHLEDIYFNYRRITWTHETGGTMAIDDWRDRAAK